jgi:hypothetical protein
VSYHRRIGRYMFLRLLVLLVAVGLEAGIATAQTVMASSVNPPLAPTLATKPKAQSKLALPQCPPAGLLPPQSSSATGHHKVILSWNASSPSPKAPSLPAGYCLYRSVTKDAPLKNPTCQQCQLVNPVAVVGTSCIDDLVADRTTYYYVVTAVDAHGNPSSGSNQASAVIVDQPPPSGAGNSPTPPACRASSSFSAK